ncbi:SIR2 family histone deacetylase (Hst4), putative [Talaromyces stipitatus ATCC 10500]|uniref:SIR2 family histone deacetylase (Hst4), putative n=1 Tax=Talaromyces stipitatus (strain ATCC 10500 / CBS 375.48 / QM 6759 / NRRL 1006) TaxID=441959 RepID=B8LW68_TALSN|nr:SIR2 family histone deacetylase (Hst4), putative [Talaromyces stipitatus ATCC 10500]EED24096.1 SIR2 family histone deacetylase (Hst4), putative [Talaromyces stipitatus ATCC 10500]
MAESASLPTLTMAMDHESSDYSYISDSSGISDLSSPPDSPQPPSECYPSPPPTQDDQEKRARASSEPAKKRRRVGPPPRSTEHLDLTNPERLPYADQLPQINLLTKTLRSHRKIVVIAGAGISTSAGIPDFRSADGLFKSVQKKHNLKASGKLLFDAAVYRDESLTASFHDMVRELSKEAADSQPTAFHHMLARMAQDNRLSRLYTQNIDCIESSLPPLLTQVPLPSKAPWPRCIQLHGSLDKMVCQKCRHLAEFDRNLFDGPEPPACPACTETDDLRTTTGQRSHGVGKMRPRIVLYNEHNPDEEAIAAVMNSDIRSRPDTVIVVGTSLKIPGVRRLVKSLCKVVRSRRNGIAMWINNEPPVGKEFEDCWDLIVKGNCEEVARLAGLKKWDDNTPPIFDECRDMDFERAKRENSVSVVVQTPSKKRTIDAGVLTPVSNNDESGTEQPKKTLANPASKGRKLTDVLGKPVNQKRPVAKKPAAKNPAANASKKPGRPPREQSAKINKYTKVTKGAKTAPVKQIKNEKDDSHNPMKNVAANILFPGLVNRHSEAKPASGTISPKGVPNGYAALID